MGKLEGRVAIVTGGSRGIGAAIVRAFLAEGAVVAFSGRKPESGESFLRELGKPDETWFCAGSGTEAEDVQALVDGTVERFGKLDILVNNVGGSNATEPLLEVERDAWEADLDWNLTSAFLATQAALRHMVPAGYGTVINISSVEGKQGQAGMVAYCTAKHGLNGFTKAVAAEVGRSGVTVNAICPGLVLTEAVTGGDFHEALGMTLDEMVDTVFKSKTLTGEINTAEQVAETAVFLASPTGRGITGAQISVDAGISTY